MLQLKAKELSLAQERSLFEQVQVVGKLGLWTYDHTTHKTSWSSGTFGLFECEQGTFQPTYEGFLGFIHPEDLEVLLEQIQMSVDTGQDYFTEYRIMIQAGNEKYIRAFGKADYDENQQPTLSFGTVQDISISKRLQKELQESENRLQMSQVVALLGHYDLNLETGLWTSSKVLDEIFGIGKAYARDVKNWVGLIHPDEQQEMLNYFQQEVLGKKQRFDREYRIVNQLTGDVIWVHGLGELIYNQAGEPIRMFGTIQNIHDRKLVQAELELSNTIFENLAEGLIVLMRNF